MRAHRDIEDIDITAQSAVDVSKCNLNLPKLIFISFRFLIHFPSFEMINLYEEKEFLLYSIRGLTDKYINETEAIKDKFTVAAYSERLAHYDMKFQKRHTEILGLKYVNFNLKYFTDNLL